MREEVTKRDPLRDVLVGETEMRQVRPHRSVERQRAALDEAHERGRGERLGDRADLEDAVRVERATRAGRTVREYARAAIGIENAHGDARRALGVDAVLDDGANGGIGQRDARIDRGGLLRRLLSAAARAGDRERGE